MPAVEPLARLYRRAAAGRLPFHVHWDLTRRCNLRCRHCYLDQGRPGRELSTRAIKAALARLARAGALNLTFSGGEPLLRPDFFALLAEARRLGFLVTLFTNGTLLGEREARLLAAHHVWAVEISLHGARAAVHDRVTGRRGSFAAARAALRRLSRRGVRAKVKFVVQRENAGEFAAVRRLARRLGAAFAFDLEIAPGEPGREGTAERELTRAELARFIRRHRLAPRGARRPRPAPDRPSCGAGEAAIYIAPDGRVRPCVGLDAVLGRITAGDPRRLLAAPFLERLRRLCWKRLEPCAGCRLARWCFRCPAEALAEGGRLDGPAPRACRRAAAARAASVG